MELDLLIQNGLLLNPDTGAETLSDVGIRNGRITLINPAGDMACQARRVLNAEGQYLLPGLIDFHTHLFRHGSGFGLDADALLSAGVTCAVDMGTAGFTNFPALFNCDLAGKKIRLRSYLNLSPIGQPGKGINEPLGDSVVDLERMRACMQAYPGQIAGVKVRISRSIVGSLGLEPLRRAVEVGEALGLPVCVHTTDPAGTAGQVAELLREGDVYSHTYQGKGGTILAENGQVQAAVLQAQKRGVLMEVGNGRVNFNFPVAESAVADGLWPDIISSDSTPATFHKEPAMWDLPMVMSKFLYLGMPLARVVKAVTVTPAQRLGMEDRIGRIALGYDADLTICRLSKEPIKFCDSDGNERTGNLRLTAIAAIRCGEILYRA